MQTCLWNQYATKGGFSVLQPHLDEIYIMILYDSSIYTGLTPTELYDLTTRSSSILSRILAHGETHGIHRPFLAAHRTRFRPRPVPSVVPQLGPLAHLAGSATPRPLGSSGRAAGDRNQTKPESNPRPFLLVGSGFVDVILAWTSSKKDLFCGASRRNTCVVVI